VTEEAFVNGTFEIAECVARVLPSRSIKAGEKTADVPSHLTPLRFGGQQRSWETVKTELDFGSLLLTTGRSTIEHLTCRTCPLMQSCSGESKPGRLG